MPAGSADAVCASQVCGLDFTLWALGKALSFVKVPLDRGLIARVARRWAALRAVGARVLAVEVDCQVGREFVHGVSVEGLSFETERTSNLVFSRIPELLDQNDHLTGVRRRELHGVGEFKRLRVTIGITSEHIIINTGKTSAAEASTMYKVSTGTSGAVRAIAIPIAAMMSTMLGFSPAGRAEETLVAATSARVMMPMHLVASFMPWLKPM